jgi:hypothetical protein
MELVVMYTELTEGGHMTGNGHSLRVAIQGIGCSFRLVRDEPPLWSYSSRTVHTSWSPGDILTDTDVEAIRQEIQLQDSAHKEAT